MARSDRGWSAQLRAADVWCRVRESASSESWFPVGHYALQCLVVHCWCNADALQCISASQYYYFQWSAYILGPKVRCNLCTFSTALTHLISLSILLWERIFSAACTPLDSFSFDILHGTCIFSAVFTQLDSSCTESALSLQHMYLGFNKCMGTETTVLGLQEIVVFKHCG